MNRFLGILVAIVMCGFVELLAESTRDSAISSLRDDSHESLKQSTNRTNQKMDCFGQSPRNDDIFLDSSLRATRYAQNDESFVDFFDDSTNRTRNDNNGEFIISYRAIMKNNILIGEEFKVTKALTTSPNPTIIAQCDIAEFSPDDSHIKTLKQNQSAILECFERELKSKIRDDIKSINNEVRTKTTYKIPAQRILLDRQRLKIHIIGQK